ncbi:MAG TPA: hypothetical protein PKV16_06695 [Caldisericia bacterium]|nr:hypothetical protein [Caldisericia bacterium]HPF48799.1 hypothetical protein [Caldisericia bacterium]HPI84277.1 hypothetical protein [Caldisericia bacterium]HPQ93455.1 hypothetical protein [Caldisericia bacterium]HRV74913.1 hypothetical protein [Caldisericia bacterium]
MRNVPRGKTQYEKLPTVFLNWDEMSQKLRGDRFSGYVQVNNDKKDGYILFKEGRITGSLYVEDGVEPITSQEALTKTTMAIQERVGNLSIYQCSLKVCDVIAWYIQGNKLYSPMESYFLNWEKFLDVMKDKSVTGFIRVSSEDYVNFINLENGNLSGHFISGNDDFVEKSEDLAKKLTEKGTIIEVYSKSETASSPVVKLEESKPIESKPISKPVEKPVEKRPPSILDDDSGETIVERPPEKPISTSPPERQKVVPLTPPPEPRKSEKPIISPDEIPDPFADKPKAAVEEIKPVIEEKPFEKPPIEKRPTGSQTMVAKPSGKIAFLIDGIRKVAQSNIGDDILPWLDGQISRVQSVNPNLTKRDLMLLVDEIERYIRQVRQNPAKATKLSTQLRHIIESFASDM